MSIDSVESSDPVIALSGLQVDLFDPIDAAYHRVVTADLTLPAGRVIGVTGASGGGKSTLAATLAGLVNPSTRVTAQSWRCGNQELWASDLPQVISGRLFERRIATRIRRDVFYISQHARSALVPHRTVQWHLQLAARQGKSADGRRIRPNRDALIELLRTYYCGKPDSANVALMKYPRELSTGECQRVQFAMAMLLRPKALIADEPFASLDPETARVLLEKAVEYVRQGGSLLLVTHHLAALRRIASLGEGLVVHQGEIVQRGPLSDLFESRRDASPVTQRLIEMAGFRFSATDTELSETESPIQVSSLTKRIADRVLFTGQSFHAPQGARFGIYGESGHGKTTLARILAGLTDYDHGEVKRLNEPEFTGKLPASKLWHLWKSLQLTYQDTDLVFDPNEAVGYSMIRSIRGRDQAIPIQKAWAIAGDLFRKLGLPPRLLEAPPVRLSGGERKRAAIARSLALLGFPEYEQDQKVLLLDEPTVGVDVFHQGVVAMALLEAQEKTDLTIIIFSHDHGFLTRFCNRMIPWPGKLETRE